MNSFVAELERAWDGDAPVLMRPELIELNARDRTLDDEPVIVTPSNRSEHSPRALSRVSEPR